MQGERIFVDDGGVEWEVYDESAWHVGWALDWDYLPQERDPGLIFISRVARRRVCPAPADWRSYSDTQLSELCRAAAQL